MPIKSVLILSAIILLSLKSVTPVLATIYQPGETLNPACSPTDTVCRVATPAASGANSDITSLTGITTPLPVGEGGIGLSTIPTGAVIYGVGSNTFSALAIGTTSQVLTVSGGGIPVWTSVSIINPGTISGNTLRWNGTNWIESGALTNNGTNISTTGNLTIGGTLVSVGSTNLVTNLNSNYLNGIGSAGFLQTGYTGFDNYNHWTLQTNGTGSTNILSANTVNFVNGVGISLSQSGSSITVSNVGVGASYSAGSGLSLSSNIFSLDLGSSNTWTALQTFGNLNIGGTFVSVGSTNLVANLNANYLNGINGSGYINVGQTGSLPYVNDVTNTSLTRSGTGPYTIALNLGSSNVWAGLQTFTGGIGVTGAVNFTNNLTVGGTFVSVGSTNLVTNLNSNYLNGISSTGYLQIGQTGTLPYVNDVTNSSLTRSGTGPYTIALNLGSSNVWAGLQTFTGGIGVTGAVNFTNNLTVGGIFVSVGSTNLVTNLNSNYLNGINGSGYVNVGQTGNFLTTGYTGFDNYNNWKLQTNGAGTTSVLSGNTVNFVNGIGISLSQSGSSITINNIGAGSTYAAGSGLTLGSNTFSLDLGSSNVWAAQQTFNGGISTTTSTALVLDSGTNGAINIGTNANAKTISIGNTVGATALNLNSGTGGINIGTLAVGKTIAIGTGGANNTINIGTTFDGSITNITSGTGNINFNVAGANTSGKVVIGNSGTTTPDLLVLDNGTTDPTGTNGAMYYNSTLNKLRCFENSAWKNCVGSETIGTGTTFFPATILGTGSSLLGIISITPSTSFGDVYIYSSLFTNSLNNSDQLITLEIRSGTTCAGTLLSSGVSTLTSANNANGSSVFASLLVNNPGPTAQSYAFCARSDLSGGASAGGQANALVIDTGADLAEMYTTNDISLEPGDVVSLDPILQAGVKKSQSQYDQNAFGIISTNPGLLIGKVENEGTKALPVALSGRVLVKVSIENGPIKAGDMLTTSSTPGVAMKATKAGAIIGTAMFDYNGQGVGKILAFIKNGSSVGVKTDQNLTSNDILSSLIQQNSQIIPATVNLSEINTDKAIAGVEMISPKITTEDFFTTNASISGTLSVNTIKANTIDGFDSLLEQKLAILQDKINIKDLEATGTARFKGPVEFQGPVIFKTIAEFIDKTIFRNRVEFADKDMGGYAIIKESTSETEIKFDKPYEQLPVVNVSLVYEGTDAPTFIEQGKDFTVAYLNRDGFKIILSTFAARDFKYHWTALAIKDAKTFVANPTIVPTPTPTPMPLPSAEPVESTPTPLPSAEPVESTTPTPVPET